MLALIFIGLMAVGVMQNITWREACKEEGPVFLTFLGGLSGCIAMIGATMTAYGTEPQTGMVIAGLIGTVVFNIVPIKQGLEYQAKFKYAKDISAFTKFKLGPVGAWLRHLLVGLGKCTKILICFTLVGIPLMKAIESSDRRINAYAKQRELEEMKKQMDELENLNKIRREVEADARKK